MISMQTGGSESDCPQNPHKEAGCSGILKILGSGKQKQADLWGSLVTQPPWKGSGPVSKHGKEGDSRGPTPMTDFCPPYASIHGYLSMHTHKCKQGKWDSVNRGTLSTHCSYCRHSASLAAEGDLSHVQKFVKLRRQSSVGFLSLCCQLAIAQAIYIPLTVWFSKESLG